MLIGIESTAASEEKAGDTTYLRSLIEAFAAIEPANRYCLYDIRPHPFYDRLPARFVRRQLPRPYTLRPFWSLPQYLARDGVQVVHALYVLPAWGPVPSVVTIHDLHFEHFPQHYPARDRWWLKTLVRHSARRANQIITGSEFSKRDIATRYGVAPEKINVIANGISHRFRPERDGARVKQVLARLGISGPYVLTYGRLIDPRKNVRRLIDAFLQPGLNAAQGYQLVVAGNNQGEAVAQLMAEARARSAGRVIFPGFVADDDLPVLVSGAAAVAFPSVFEGFGLPVLEAMACGVPVITSSTTSLPEVAGDAAVLVDPLDTGALARALDQVLGDAALRQRLSQDGLRRAAAFTWERCARQTLAVFAACGRRSGGRT